MVVYYCLWDSWILTSILSFRTAALEYIIVYIKINWVTTSYKYY